MGKEERKDEEREQGFHPIYYRHKNGLCLGYYSCSAVVGGLCTKLFNIIPLLDMYRTN